MVIVADQVQDTMDNHPVQLVLEFGTVEQRVLPDGINGTGRR